MRHNKYDNGYFIASTGEQRVVVAVVVVSTANNCLAKVVYRMEHKRVKSVCIVSTYYVKAV